MIRICECGHEDRDHLEGELTPLSSTYEGCDVPDCACELYSENADLTAEANRELRREKEDQA